MSAKTEVRQKNERVKRKYWEYLKESTGQSELSKRSIEKAISKYEDATGHEDFALCNPRRAILYKKYLETHLNAKSDKPMGLKSRYHTLRLMSKFVAWLSVQPGYKSKLENGLATYFNLSLADRRQALMPSQPRYPTLEQIKRICSFPVTNEIEQRDRALISFVAMTGMRDMAVATLPIGAYNPQTKEIRQLPTMGVKTKFSKEIYTTLLSIDTELCRYFEEWYTYLVVTKKYSLTEPMFPSTEMGMVGPDHHAYIAKGISHNFWADAGPLRNIFRDRALQMGVEYFYPHSYRHFVTAETEKHLSTPEQFKAFSQSLGHEHIATTFSSYGRLSPSRTNEVMREVNFGKSSSDSQDDEKIKQMFDYFKKITKK